MTWDPYDPHDMFRERDGHRLPEEPVKGRAVAAVFVGIVLLAIIFTIAANAQQATTQTGAGGAGEQAQEQQEPPAVTSSTAPRPDAQAPEQAAEARPLDGQIVEQPEGTRMTSELIGQPVSTAEGEEMGKIADLLLTEDNRVAAAVVGVGGFLGFGERLIAVEIDRFQQVPVPEGGARLALNVTRAELEQAPEFVSLAEQRSRQEAQQLEREAQQMQQPGTGSAQQPASEPQPMTQ